VRSFARRKPGAYLAIALGAGVLAGRLTRGLTSSSDSAPTTTSSGGSLGGQYTPPPVPSLPLTTDVPATDPDGFGVDLPVQGSLGYDPVPSSVPPLPSSSGSYGTTGLSGAQRGNGAP